MRESLIATLLFLAFCAGMFVGYLAGAHNAEAAEEDRVRVNIVRMADTGGVAPPTPTMKATPTPTFTPTPEVKDSFHVREGCPRIIVETFGATAPAACEVAWCESRYERYAVGAAAERSWFQVHPIHGYPGWSFDPVAHVTYAYELSNGGTDWSHWSCKP